VRLKAVVIVPRIQGTFQLEKAVVYASFGDVPFKGFDVSQVRAAYREKSPLDAFGVVMVFEKSQLDEDFKALTWFPKQGHISLFNEALDRSDEMTHYVLKRAWGGVRPVMYAEDILS
jgi:hypothetical protein